MGFFPLAMEPFNDPVWEWVKLNEYLHSFALPKVEIPKGKSKTHNSELV